MTKKSDKRAAGQGTAKGAAVALKSEQINLRVTAEQKAALQRLAGDDSISGYLLGRALGGGARHAVALRTIKQLHDIGRQLQRLADRPSAEREDMDAALRAVRASIDRLAGAAIAEADDQVDAP